MTTLRINYLPLTFLGGAIVAFSIGCVEPSIRYVRDPDGKLHMFVPGNWDYRTQYKVPEVKLQKITDAYIGTRYKNGGMDRRGVDCSGFVCLVFSELNHARLPRSSRKQWKIGKLISIGEARPGDFVFFRGGLFGTVNHVGIYMGNNHFIHASSSKGVVYDSLDEEYFQKHFAGIRRIF